MAERTFAYQGVMAGRAAAEERDSRRVDQTPTLPAAPSAALPAGGQSQAAEQEVALGTVRFMHPDLIDM